MKLMSCLAATLAFMAVSHPAAACFWMPNVLQEYVKLRQSGVEFTVVKGHLTGTPGTEYELREDGWNSLPSLLTGHRLGSAGFTKPYDEAVSYVIDPLYTPAPIDPGYDVQLIVFVTPSPEGPIIKVADCGAGTMGYIHASEAEIATLVRCHQGGSCEVGE